MKNYKKISEEMLKEVNAKMTIYEHIKTGARVCTFDTDDTNKVFAIAFKTPAIDSTGVTHIIEHSVLCGSKKYPVKDPFVELLKGSLNTFLNAFTYGDKTVYPCASKNDKDFLNLMDIYLNAVFYPRIYQHKEIFLQEGWHYEIFNKNDPIKINGVVYNEMKGALSDKDEVLVSELQHELYSDNTYRYESGGDPANIPDLTYENFLNFHKNYYSPSNAYIYIYGKMDMEERLEFLDREYLSKFDKIDIHPEIDLSKDFGALKEKTIYYPVATKEEMEGKPINYGIAYNLVKSSDIKEDIAFDILDKVLFNSSSAVIKNKLLESGVCDDVNGGNMDGQNESTFLIVAKNSKEEYKEKLLKVLNDSYKELANGGLDHNAIFATICNTEFSIRENKFTYYPLGLSIILKSLDSWLYNDKEPALKLDVLKYFEELKDDLKNGYFEKLIEKYFINSKHEVVITQKPSLTLQAEKDKELENKLTKFKASLSDKEIEDLIKMNNDLRAYQAKEDSTEKLATIPHLSLEDLKNDKVEDYSIKLEKKAYPFYYCEKFTNSVIYGGYLFDIKKLPKKYLSEVSLLSSMFTRLATKNYSVEKLDETLNLLTGNASSSIISDAKYNKEDYTLYFSFEFSTLKENLNKTISLIKEILYNTVFDNDAKVLEVLNSEKGRFEMTAIRNGHMVSLNRANSSQSELGFVNEQISGIAYYDFVCDLIKNFKDKKVSLIKDFKDLVSVIFVKENFIAYSTLETNNLMAFKKETDGLYSGLLNKKCDLKDDFVFKKSIAKEAICAPIDVNFVSRASSEKLITPLGKAQVLVKALSLDYYWAQLRVKGGAYGGGILIKDSCPLGLYSYRDPHIKESNEVYFATPKFVESMKYNDEEMLKFKIGAIGDETLVLHVSDAGRRALVLALRGYTYSDALKNREDLLDCTVNDLKSYAKDLDKLIKGSSLCVFGNGNLIEENKVMFDSVRNLSK